MISVGVAREETQKVTSEIAIDFLGIEGARVLSTPNLILGLERTARNLVFPLLDPGYDTVGTHVNVYHLAATPMGMNATFRAEVTSVEERRVNFKVEGFRRKAEDRRGHASASHRQCRALCRENAGEGQSLTFQTGTSSVEVAVRTLIIAGWTGRDRAAVEKHIVELEAVGVPRPASVPGVLSRVGIAFDDSGRD